MSIHELLDRTNLVYEKYEKYVLTRDNDRGAGDAFAAAHADVLVKVAALASKADEAAAAGGDRAARAALNAEIRRGKTALFEVDLPALDRLARRGWRKLPKEVVTEREAKAAAARDAVAAVPDGLHAPRAPPALRRAPPDKGKAKAVVVLDEAKMGVRQDADGYYAPSEAAAAFRKEADDAATRQDKVLNDIERGVGDLRGLGDAMGTALDAQGVLAVAIDDKVDEASTNIKRSNKRMTGLVAQLRTSRNFCLDITLLSILLALALYIYKVVAKK